MDTEARLARLESQARQWRAVCAGLFAILILGVIAAVGSRTAVAAGEASSRPVQNAANGRYQVSVAERGVNPLIVIIDTWTGHFWTADGIGGAARDQGLPPGIGKD